MMHLLVAVLTAYLARRIDPNLRSIAQKGASSLSACSSKLKDINLYKNGSSLLPGQH